MKISASGGQAWRAKSEELGKEALNGRGRWLEATASYRDHNSNWLLSGYYIFSTLAAEDWQVARVYFTDVQQPIVAL